MKRIPQPAEHYDNKLLAIDEQICSLLQQRKAISNNNPGVPPDDALANWAEQYEIYPDFLVQLFGIMRYENLFKAKIEPKGFRKHLPVLKSIEISERLYSITSIRQYDNASIVPLHIDWDELLDDSNELRSERNRTSFELSISEQYDCRMDRGGGSTGHRTYNFIVSPPLPDETSGIELVFKEFSDSLKEMSTGLEIIINL